MIAVLLYFFWRIVRTIPLGRVFDILGRLRVFIANRLLLLYSRL